MQNATPEKIIEISHLKNYLGQQWVHKDVNMTINRGEILAIVGGSGSGKTTIIRSILMLQKPTSGTIKVFGEDLSKISRDRAKEIRQRWGMLFQQGALFSSLTLLENVMFPLQEFSNISHNLQTEIAKLKISLSGLPLTSLNKYPSELSGGMRKRAALARAIILDPELLFLDEPTAGLDPNGAEAFDDMILELRNNLGLTIVMVTHDLDSLWQVADRVAFLADGKVIASEPMQQLIHHPHPAIQSFFGGRRGQVSRQQSRTNDDKE